VPHTGIPDCADKVMSRCAFTTAAGVTIARRPACRNGQCWETGSAYLTGAPPFDALKLTVHIGLDEIREDEFCAMLIIGEERDLLKRERATATR
jgi:hypothetical protein